MSKPRVLILGTCDSKLEELLFVRKQIVAQDRCDAILIDLGHKTVSHPDIATSQSTILSRYNETHDAVEIEALDRGSYTRHMISAATAYVSHLMTTTSIHGVIGIGGSTGTSLCSPVMRTALPIGLPKLLVSTMASGDVSQYIDNVDITMMYSVVDIAGLNFLSEAILGNAAAAVTGMALAYQARISETSGSRVKRRTKRVGLTMFGVTTPACDRVRQTLENEHRLEVIVFHCTGAGGRAMERLVREKVLDAVVDLTTTEVADELVGGVLTAGPDRLTAAAEAGIPQVISVGACDMVNFGPLGTVPKIWEEQDRKLYVHNPAVTLMRTNVGECQRIGEFIADKLRSKTRQKERVKVLLPVGGVSMISIRGGVFEDEEADEALFTAVESGLEGTGIEVIRDSRAINDDGFANLVVEAIVGLV